MKFDELDVTRLRADENEFGCKQHAMAGALGTYSQDDSKFFETELQREISSQHALYNVEVKAVARRIDSDDVLYALINHRWPYAVVHLTYAGSDSHAEWPHTQFFESLQDWIEEGMKVDNRSYNS